MSALTLYGWDRSTYTRSVLLALHEKGLEAGLIEVNPFAEEGLSASYKAMQPFGKIPVLVHGDVQIYETVAILRYLDEAFPGPALQPSDPGQRAQMQQIIALLDSYGYRALVWDLFVNLREGPLDTDALERGRDTGRKALAEIARLARGPLLLGESITLADCHLAPILRYAIVPDEGRALIEEQQTITDWWRLVMARPGWEALLSLPSDL